MKQQVFCCELAVVRFDGRRDPTDARLGEPRDIAKHCATASAHNTSVCDGRRSSSEYRREYNSYEPRNELRPQDIKMPDFDPDAPGVTVGGEGGWFHRRDVMIDTSERFKNKKWDCRRLYGLVVGLLAGRASEWHLHTNRTTPEDEKTHDHLKKVLRQYGNKQSRLNWKAGYLAGRRKRARRSCIILERAPDWNWRRVRRGRLRGGVY